MIEGHGDDLYRYDAGMVQMNFSTNIYQQADHTALREYLAEHLDVINSYPEPQPRSLEKVIAQKLGITPEAVIVTNGATEAIYLIAQMLHHSASIIPQPTFNEYADACRINHHIISYENTDDLKELPNDRVYWICNPNNPTGKLMDKDLLLTVLKHCEELQIPLLIDECFMDFVADESAYSMTDQLANHPGLIILKAFTKSYAIPGVRLGYCLTSDASLIEKLYTSGQDWNVSALAQAAGIAALDEDAYLAESRQLLAEERNYLITQLRMIGLKVFEGSANYILIKSLHDFHWPEKLRKHHILIRDCSNYRGLSTGFYRIAVKTRKDNRKLIKIMKDYVKHAFITYIN